MLLCLHCVLLTLILPAHATEHCTAIARTAGITNVKEHGARGDGKTDDTAAIQSAIDRTAGTGGTVLIPDGVYLIDALASVFLRSDMTVRMADGAVLKALPNASERSSIIMIRRVSNANLIGGTLLGERDEHQGKAGEWGMGIFVDGASNITIEGTKARNAWGDGFYVRGASTNIRFCSVEADNNRRQGMSIVSANGVLVQDSVFKNTNGTAPQAGIDIEPNESDSVLNVRIQDSRFIDNHGIGVQIYVAPKTRRPVRAITIDGNTVIGNRLGGIYVGAGSEVAVSGNTVTGNHRFGVFLAKGTKGNSARNNVLGSGQRLVDEGANEVLGNRHP
jgi:parallel beta-helix repeat protein